MSIEKMVMLNMVGQMTDIDHITKAVVLAGCLQPVSAIQQINTTDFTFKATEDNLDVLMDVCYIRPFSSERDYTQLLKNMDKLRDICSIDKHYLVNEKELITDYKELENSITTMTSKFENIYNLLQEKKKERQDISLALERLGPLKDVDVMIEDLTSLKNFKFSIMKILPENMKKLKENYGNIPSVVLSLRKDVNYETFMALTPYILENEAERIFNSLNCEVVALPENLNGTPKEIMDYLLVKHDDLINEVKKIENELKVLSKEYYKKITIINKSLELEIKSNDVKNTMAFTNEFFYFSGWVPENSIKALKRYIKGFEDRLIITERQVQDINHITTPPTKMKNGSFIKPFESMVTMYGIPSYGELDPTLFLGISYMIIFGAMFGDVGQGIIFILAGLYLSYGKNNKTFGGVVSRLGISSTLFGFAYGSIFGFEEIIEPLFIRPMEDIMQVLIYAVIFGCALLAIGFIFSLINNYRKKDIENGVFGKDGLVGFIFYMSLLGFIFCKYRGIQIIPNILWYTVFITALILMLLKEPLANLVSGKRPLYNESKKDYFVEGGFGVVETLLSLFSNTLSFIRVGAFALNHVGLFLAFSALAQMMKNGIGGVFVYVLGNIIIIGLEGLIVFIQGLRLEYYELFSKYFDGSGVPFEPVNIEK